mmetsp:Transcript_25379/g.39796  ORF Transcript_25379/g.39796 Transcript_25379/m.39796 type:complete len:493 (+) Transcript_25379:157-1635(+)
MSRALRIKDSPNLGAKMGKRSVDRQSAKKGSQIPEVTKYFGEEEDNLLWQLRVNDESVNPKKFGQGTGRVRGNRLGFKGDIVSKHSVLAQFERLGPKSAETWSIFNNRAEQERMEGLLLDLHRKNIEAMNELVWQMQGNLPALSTANRHQTVAFEELVRKIHSLLFQCIQALEDHEIHKDDNEMELDDEISVTQGSCAAMKRIRLLLMELGPKCDHHAAQVEALSNTTEHHCPFLRRANYTAAQELAQQLMEGNQVISGRKAVHEGSEEGQKLAKQREIDLLVEGEEQASNAFQGRLLQLGGKDSWSVIKHSSILQAVSGFTASLRGPSRAGTRSSTRNGQRQMGPGTPNVTGPSSSTVDSEMNSKSVVQDESVEKEERRKVDCTPTPFISKVLAKRKSKKKTNLDTSPAEAPERHSSRDARGSRRPEETREQRVQRRAHTRAESMRLPPIATPDLSADIAETRGRSDAGGGVPAVFCRSRGVAGSELGADS